MVSQRQKREMSDYIAAMLEASGLKAQPRRKELMNGLGLETGYILVGKNEGIVLLVDQIYPNDSFASIYQGIREQIPNIAAAIYKDGKTFFRSAVGEEEITGIKSKRFKMNKGLSLKNYSDEQLRKMISFRPEEEFLMGRNSKGVVQYFQPASERLERGIMSYKFMPVILDYSHIPDEGRFGNVQEESKRLRIWDAGDLNKGLITIADSYLKPQPKTESKAA